MAAAAALSCGRQGFCTPRRHAQLYGMPWAIACFCPFFPAFARTPRMQAPHAAAGRQHRRPPGAFSLCVFACGWQMIHPGKQPTLTASARGTAGPPCNRRPGQPLRRACKGACWQQPGPAGSTHTASPPPTRETAKAPLAANPQHAQSSPSRTRGTLPCCSLARPPSRGLNRSHAAPGPPPALVAALNTGAPASTRFLHPPATEIIHARTRTLLFQRTSRGQAPFSCAPPALATWAAEHTPPGCRLPRPPPPNLFLQVNVRIPFPRRIVKRMCWCLLGLGFQLPISLESD